jgi:hypothetical protein
MLFEWATLGVLLAMTAGATMILANRYRLILIGFVAHYLAVYLLLFPVVGWQVGLVKPLAGAIAAAIIAFSSRGQIDSLSDQTRDLIDRPLFRLGAMLLVIAAGWGMGRASWIQIPALSNLAQTGALILFVLGLLMAAFFDDPIRAGMGIVTSISGFEIIYAAVEPSLAVLALLAGVQISLALVIGYLAQFDEPVLEDVR